MAATDECSSTRIATRRNRGNRQGERYWSVADVLTALVCGRTSRRVMRSFFIL